MNAVNLEQNSAASADEQETYLLRYAAHAVPKDNLAIIEFTSVGTGCA